jgi:hypothetical protein
MYMCKLSVCDKGVHYVPHLSAAQRELCEDAWQVLYLSDAHFIAYGL